MGLYASILKQWQERNKQKTSHHLLSIYCVVQFMCQDQEMPHSQMWAPEGRRAERWETGSDSGSEVAFWGKRSAPVSYYLPHTAIPRASYKQPS